MCNVTHIVFFIVIVYMTMFNFIRIEFTCYNIYDNV